MTGDAQERQRRAVELRLAGAGYEQIAQQVGYRGPSGAHQAVQRGLEKLLHESPPEVRQLELERLDALLLGLWPKARRGDSAAVDRVLKVMERRSVYLELAKPTQEPQPEQAPATPLDEFRARREARKSK